MTRDDMVDALRSGMCKVTFTKKDGTTRVMPCTLNFDLIPDEHKPKGGEDSVMEGVERTISAIRVYAPESDGWRSFIVDNVQSFEIETAA